MFFKTKICAIPLPWISKVSEKLNRGSDSEIEWTKKAFSGWHTHGKHQEAHDAMVKALAVPGVSGKLVKMPIDEGPTYAFFFTAHGLTMYGKICLTYDGRLIIIHSAHEREREEL
jgi:hypothetical protein